MTPLAYPEEVRTKLPKKTQLTSYHQKRGPFHSFTKTKKKKEEDRTSGRRSGRKTHAKMRETLFTFSLKVGI